MSFIKRSSEGRLGRCDVEGSHVRFAALTHVSLKDHIGVNYCVKHGLTLYARAEAKRPARSHMRPLAPQLTKGHLI